MFLRNPILSSVLKTVFLSSFQLSARILLPFLVLLQSSPAVLTFSEYLLLFDFYSLAVLTVIKSEVSLSFQDVRER